MNDLPTAVFFDEVRSHRNWITWFYIPVCAFIALVVLWLLMGGVIVLLRDGNSGGWIGVIFGLPMSILFGLVLWSLIRRVSTPPIRVRIDQAGVAFGDWHKPWSEIAEIRARAAVGVVSVWILVRPRNSLFRLAKLVPGPVPVARWNRLADELAEHFRLAGIQTRIVE